MLFQLCFVSLTAVIDTARSLTTVRAEIVLARSLTTARAEIDLAEIKSSESVYKIERLCWASRETPRTSWLPNVNYLCKSERNAPPQSIRSRNSISRSVKCRMV